MLKFKWETEFKEAEIGEIPKDWNLDKLKWAVRNLESGNRPKGGSLKHKPQGVLSIGGENITWKGDLILDNCLRFGKDFYESLKRGKIEEQDILLVKDGATIGKLSFIKKIPEGRAMVNEHVFLIKTDKKKYNPLFLFYYLFSQAGQIQIENAIGGSAQGGINRDILDIVEILRFNNIEQSRIATVLSWFDDLVENKKRQNEILEKTAEAIFKSWFIDFEPFKDEEFVDSELGKIPKGWEVKSIGELFNLIKGKAKSSQTTGEYMKNYLPYVDVETYKKGYPMFWVEKKQPIVDEKDIAIIADGESSGRIFRYQQGVLSSTLLVLKQKTYANDYDVRHLVYLWLKSVEDELMFNRTGTYIQHLDKGYLSMLSILFPPDNLLKKFHSLVEPLFRKIITNQKQIMALRQVRDTLLPLLVFGKLRVEEI